MVRLAGIESTEASGVGIHELTRPRRSARRSATNAMRSSRATLDGIRAKDVTQLADDVVLALGGARVGAIEAMLHMEARERAGGGDELAGDVGALDLQDRGRSQPSGTRATSTSRPAPRKRSPARRIARAPASSPSSISTTVGARRLSTATWCSLTTVPISATVLLIPA